MLKGPMLPLLGPVLAGLVAVLNTSLFTDITKTTWASEYDYVIVGAGSAGSVLAARLTEDPSVSVLLLEAGGSTGGLLTEIPFYAGQLQKTDLDWTYRTVPQENACKGLKEQRSAWPRGKVLGGSSVINYMFYSRGNRLDYDKWASEEGCTGWSWDEVFSYFLKMEDQRDPEYLKSGYHATGGPLTVESIDVQSPLTNAFLESGRYLGYEIGDINGPRQSWYYPQGTTRDGKRCSVVKAYLQPAANRTNLDIVSHALVTKILFEQDKRQQPEAVGVEFRREYDPYQVRARKEVILSAGSINSPQLLMLSGVGPAEHLRELGIPLVANLPVGDNLHEQIWTPLSYEVPRPTPFKASNPLTPANLVDFLVYRKGPLTSLGGVEAFGFVQTSYANQSLDWPDFEILFGAQSVASGGQFRKVQDLTEEFYEQLLKPYEQTNTIGLLPTMLRPKSRGTLRLQSTDPTIQPLLDPRYLTHPDDIKSMVEALKITLKIAEAPPLARHGIKLFYGELTGCKDLERFSDAELECYARTYTAAFWHPGGTCRMGALEDPRTVVDPQLRVKGVGRLRVVDASIMPFVVTGHTNAPTIMIAEKAADMILGINSIKQQPSVPID